MVKKFINFFICIAIVSCSPLKNEFGRARFNESKFKVKPSNNFEINSILDSKHLFKLDSVIEVKSNKRLIEFNQIYLKFYNDGRVGVFQEDQMGKLNLNPKNATMGFYNFENDKMVIEYYWNTPQSGNFSVILELIFEGNNLLAYSNYYRDYFSKIETPPEYSNYIPDW